MLAGRRALDDVAGITVLDDWRRAESDGHPWALRVSVACPSAPAGGPVAASTEWYLTVADDYPMGRISFLPAVVGGLPGFFPHQARDFPDIVPARPWRGAKICVATRDENNLSNTADEEPYDAEERLAFQASRAVEWVRRASLGILLGPGEPFELPVFTMDGSRPRVAFREGPETFAEWQKLPQQSGLADLVQMGPRGGGWAAVRQFLGPTGIPLVSPEWGFAVAGARSAGKAIWLRLPSVPVLPPWQAPVTWGELREAARTQKADLDAIFAAALPLARRAHARYLLFGFPVEEQLGSGNYRYHWLPAALTVTVTRLRRRDRKPGRKKLKWILDYRVEREDGDAIRWCCGENWHPDQIGSRGRLPKSLTEARVLLIGAGALGSSVAEMLVRGGVSDLTVFDPQRVEAGNLVRHTLGVDAIGTSKALALAAHLNGANPNAKVRGFAAPFPSAGVVEIGLVERSTLVIDATASPQVADWLGRYPWRSRRRFAALALTYAAENLLAYVADGQTFPTEAYWRAVRPWSQRDQRAARPMPHEGVGCWHPVFPARADHVLGLAAAAVETLASWKGDTEGELRVLARTEGPDGPAISPVAPDAA